MFKWMDQLRTAKIDFQSLSTAKSAKELEQKVEALLEKISTNPQFLSALSFILNTQSQVKSVVNFTFEKVWKNMQLPNKKDQERTLYLLHELQFKIHQMEKEVTRLRGTSKQEALFTTRPITVLNKAKSHQKTDVTASKRV